MSGLNAPGKGSSERIPVLLIKIPAFAMHEVLRRMFSLGASHNGDGDGHIIVQMDQQSTWVPEKEGWAGWVGALDMRFASDPCWA